ncbi:MAG: DUF4958 family protein [Alistipes sp.]|nr:DUF4958 family protein [Alistipes sp.]
MKSFFRNACCAVLTLLLTAGLAACSDDDTQSGGLQLYYPTVVDIGPSMSFMSGVPTYKGPAPSEFSIAGITLDDAAVVCDSFSINPDTGIVSISDTDDLATGVYKLTVSCRAGGGYYTFPDVFVVSMAAATPEAVEVSTPLLELSYAELAIAEISIAVKPVGESVSIQNYTLIQAEGCEYFAISRNGVITLNPSFTGEILPGTYTVSLRLDTYAGSKTYDDILTAHIFSEPLEIRYPSAEGRMEYNMAFTSTVPTLKGSPEGLTWAIKRVEPSTDKIAIDAATGVLSVEEGSEFAIGDSFTIDLTVTNDYGSTDFDSAFRLTVIEYIAPIDPETFGYDDVEAIQGGEFSAVLRAGFTGDEVSFTLGALPEELEGQLSIDEVSGTVSAVKGHTIPIGTYAIPVKASNFKNEVETVINLTVKENPYYFTKVHYGNNLGLTPSEDYANQFLAPTSADLQALTLMPVTDAKPGTEITWSVKMVHKLSSTTIDAQTGELSLRGGYTANNGGMVLVTATAGKGQVGETSVTVPVFVSHMNTTNGVNILYKPFVMQVNPRKGGTSVIPEVTGVDPNLFCLDYRRTFNYYNIGGPEWHGSGIAAGTLLYQLWSNYYTSINKAVNTGSKDPVSYYSNASTTNLALVYVEPTTKAVVVNANKWVDNDNVAANGAFFAQMTYVTDGNTGNINNGSQAFPLWIWFDENF